MATGRWARVMGALVIASALGVPMGSIAATGNFASAERLAIRVSLPSPEDAPSQLFVEIERRTLP